MFTRDQRAGFTFIELMFSITLMFIIAGMSVGFYSRFFTQNAVLNTQNQLAASLRKAQMYSMMGKQDSQWGVNILNKQITFFKGSSYSSRNPAFDEIYVINNNITITGFSDVVFSRITGLPSTTPLVTITGNNQSKTVSVNSQGIVSK